MLESWHPKDPFYAQLNASTFFERSHFSTLWDRPYTLRVFYIELALSV